MCLAPSYFLFWCFCLLSTSLMSLPCVCILTAWPAGLWLDVRSSLRRRAALIGADRETRGKDAANWLVGWRVHVQEMTEQFTRHHWLLRCTSPDGHWGGGGPLQPKKSTVRSNKIVSCLNRKPLQIFTYTKFGEILRRNKDRGINDMQHSSACIIWA